MVPSLAERGWQLCRLVWVVFSALDQRSSLRARLALVAAQLPARVWFSVVRPLQRAAAEAGSTATVAGAAGVALGGAPSGCDPSHWPRPASPWGGCSSSAWHDPGGLLPLAVLGQSLSSFMTTAADDQLAAALPLAEVFDAAAPHLGLLPMMRQSMWQVRGGGSRPRGSMHCSRAQVAGCSIHTLAGSIAHTRDTPFTPR